MRKILPLLFVLLALCAGAYGEINISPASGFYSDSVEVTISSSLAGKIYYSLDGTMDNPIEYTGPVTLKKTGDYHSYTVKAWNVQGETASEGYMIGDDCSERFDLPVAIVQTADYNLHDYEIGIFEKGKAWDDYDAANPGNDTGKGHHPANYNQRGDEWLRFSTITILSADGEKILSQSAGMGISGAASSSNEVQKSLRFDADEDYDANFDSFTSELISGVAGDGSLTPTLDKYKSIILRNGGNDFPSTMIRWNLISELFRRAGENTVTAASPCVVFVNGEYYGLAQFQPRLSTKFIADSVGIEEKDLIEKYKGGARTFFNREPFLYLYNGDFSTEESIVELDKTLDVAGCMRYIALEIFCGNGDWNGNTLVWRYTGEEVPGVEETDGRWRFIPYDLDYAFGLNKDAQDTFDMATDINSTSPILLFAGDLLDNKYCRDIFLADLYQLTGEVFTGETIVNTVDKEAALVITELTERTPIEKVKSRDRAAALNWLKECALGRREALYARLREYYGFSGSYTLSFEDCGEAANIRINGVKLGGAVSGEWFNEAKCSLSCSPHPGYEFDHWVVNGIEYRDTVLTLTEDMRESDHVNVSAALRQLPQALVIQAFASQGNDDYVVIKNVGTEEYVLRGVWLSDDPDRLYKQPLDGILPAGQELTVSESSFYGGLTFGLKNGETLYLSGKDGIIDSVYVRKMGTNQEYRRIKGGDFGFFAR